MDEVGVVLGILARLREGLFFLVTTEPGWILLGTLFLGYLFLSVYFRLKSTAPEEHLRWKGRIAPAVGAVLLELGGLVARTAAALPTLLGVLVITAILSTTASGIDEMTQFLENQREIRRLETALKHLENRHKVARVRVTDQRRGVTSLVIDFFDRSGKVRPDDSQQVSVPGRDIYFDSVVLNFAFSEIEEGGRNLALPYRVFSDEIPAAEGIPLRIYNNQAIPFLYERGDEDIYGIEPEEYKNALRRLTGYLQNPEEAREDGVRTTYGNAVHRVVEPGDSFIVWIEQTGGLVIKAPRAF